MLKFETRSALLDQNFKKMFTYLKSALLNLCKWQNFCKTKFQIWDTNCLIFLLLGCNFKELFSYLKLAPWNLSKSKVTRKNQNP